MKYSTISPVAAYRSVPGKRPWALKHNSQFWPAWALFQDQNSICLYRSCYIYPLKWGTWTLTREWALAQDTTVVVMVHVVKLNGRQYSAYTFYINASAQ